MNSLHPNFLLLWLLLGGASPLMAQGYRMAVDTLAYQPLEAAKVLWQWEQPVHAGSGLMVMPFDFFYWGRQVLNLQPALHGGTFIGTYEACFFPFRPALVPKPGSQLRYTLEGEGRCGDRVLKIEWHRFGMACDSLEAQEISFQLWLHEANSTLSLHHGPQEGDWSQAFPRWQGRQACVASNAPSSSRARSLTSDYGLLLFGEGWEGTIYWQNDRLAYIDGWHSNLHTSQYADPLAPLPEGVRLHFSPEEAPELAALSVFPNPVGDQLFVRREWGCESLHFTLHDRYGRQLADFPYDGPSFSLPTAALAPGLYLLRALRPDGSLLQTWKLWKE